MEVFKEKVGLAYIQWHQHIKASTNANTGMSELYQKRLTALMS